MPALTEELRKDPAWRILNYKYSIRVPRFVTIDPEFSSNYGITTDEAANPNERMELYVTIPRMLDFVERGAIPVFKDKAKAGEVSETIIELIKQWQKALYESPDVVDVPVEYLTRLETLYRAIFAQARIGKAEDILTGTETVAQLERYLNQRRRNDESGLKERAKSLPDAPVNAYELIEEAAKSREGRT